MCRILLTALGYDTTNTGDRIKHVPIEWRGSVSIATPSGNQDMLILSY